MLSRFKVGLVVTAALLPITAMAQQPGGAQAVERRLAACATEREPERRLACFDAIVAAEPMTSVPASTSMSGATPTPPAAEKEHAAPQLLRDPDGRIVVSGAWRVLRLQDFGTNKPRIIVFTEGKLEFGQSAKPPSLNLRCLDQQIEVFYDAGNYIGAHDTFPTIVRFDDSLPQTQGWTSSTRGTVVFSPDPADFMQGLYRATRQVLIEATAFNGQRYRARFSIAGLTKMLPDLAACWRPVPLPGRE